MATPRDPESTIRDAIEGARPLPRGGERRRNNADDGRGRSRAPEPDDDGGDDDVIAAAAEFRLPEGGPVQPLGRDGNEFYFMNADRQFVIYSYKDFGAHGLSALHGGERGQAWLDRSFPRIGGKNRILGLDKERAVRSYIAACSAKGVFDADNKLRNVGAWIDIDGRLLWHLGDAVLIVEPNGQQHYAKVGPIGDHVYPLGAPQLPPAKPDRKAQRAAVDQLYRILQQWPWKRGELAARLQLGHIGCQLIGGALKWRPAVWATGGQGTGKSTLHRDVIHQVLGGDGATVKTGDASGAGIHQALRNRSLPVLFDELEPGPGKEKKVGAVIDLAIASSSGDTIIRGTADHGHKEFILQSAFHFSSIHVPRLKVAAAMRIAVLELAKIPDDAAEPVVEARAMRDIGAQLRRLLVDRWQHWPKRLQSWREGLRRRKFSARVADTWGTLLAMADHMLDESASVGTAHGDDVDKWCDELKPWLKELVTTSGSDDQRLWHTLLTKAVDPYQKGQRWPISTLLAVSAKRQSIEEESAHSSERVVVLDHRKAAAGLETLGLKVGWFKKPASKKDDQADDQEAAPPVFSIAVVKNHSELNKLLWDTDWKDDAYSQTLMRMPGAWSAQQRIAGSRPWCAMVPFELVFPTNEEAAQKELEI